LHLKYIELSFRSPLQNNWEKDRECSESREWDTQSNRNQRNDSFLGRTNPSNFGGNHNDNGSRNRDDHSKRFMGNRRNRNTSENDEGRRPESPSSNRNFGNRRDNLRDVRQVSWRCK
jgi:hypothetical protein